MAIDGDSVWGSIKERLADPFMGRYTVSFVLLNWKCFVAVLGSEGTTEKIRLVQKYIYIFCAIDGFWGIFFNFSIPALIALLMIYIWPKLSLKFKTQIKKNEVFQHNAFLEEEINLQRIQVEVARKNEAINMKDEKIKELQLQLNRCTGRSFFLDYVAKVILEFDSEAMVDNDKFKELCTLFKLTRESYALAGNMIKKFGKINFLKFADEVKNHPDLKEKKELV